MSPLASLRLAVVSTTIPPAPSGQARALGALFAEGTCAPPLWFTDAPLAAEPDQPLYGRRVRLDPARFLLAYRLKVSWLHGANNWAGLAQTVVHRSREIAAQLSAERVDALIGCSGNPFDLPAAWLAARRRRLPFVAWLFDDPVMQWRSDEIYRGFARFWERVWGRYAGAIIVPNEVMQATFCARMRSAAERVSVVRNPAAPECFDAPPATWPGDPWCRVIVYTGSVYAAQEDAFRNLVAALELLEGRYGLHIYTPQTQSDLERLGISGRFVTYHAAVSHRETLERQRQADVLFLPLAFESPLGEVILSSAPGKMGEYLAAGRPILAHAPPGSFVSEFFRRTGAGSVVDRPEPVQLAAELSKLDGDPQLRHSIISAAVLAADEFRVEHARAKIADALGPLVGQLTQ